MSAEDLSHHSTAQLWLLIECCPTSGNGGNELTYTVIDSIDVIAPREKMHTGKSIKYRKGNSICDGTIVIISDDKNFLDAELRQLIGREVVIKKEVYGRKRKKQTTNNYDQSCLSPAWSTSTSTDNLNQCSGSQSSFQIFVPPMTFDQQTQTDFKGSIPLKSDQLHTELLQKINMNLEKILSEQQFLHTDNIQTKQQLSALENQSDNLHSMLNEISDKLTKPTSVVVEEHELTAADDSEKNGEPVVVFTCSASSKHSTPNRILNLTNSKISDIAIETYDFNHDSNMSVSNSSKVSIGESNSSSFNLKCKENRPALSKNFETTKFVEILKSDWPEEETEDLQERVPIGRNKTTVPKYVLKQINWNSHTSATRRLLTALFSREVLATHSLTGKPSPAFIDSNKPVKNQLDATIISDIIQCVVQQCNVTETAVRSSITTKCADENKMMRQRVERKRKALQAVNETTSNKENCLIVDKPDN